ncbi:MAG: hypothetical protein CGW95_09975 [Phenylobacterium zucineum]|nr:MAG: hypothetical protein CGW95_09975 [Phenylobacterium zucineum]
MQTLKALLIAGVASLGFGGIALAEDSPAVSFNIGAASDYMFRGVSQTDGQGQVFGGVDVAMGQAYAGTWVSNVDFNNGTNMEYDFYAGYKPQVGPVAFDLGVIYYGYANKPSGPDEAYWEAKVAGSVPVGKGTVGAAVYYSPEFPFKAGQATYYEINASAPLTEKASVSGAIGHQSVVGPADYNTWNLGVGYALTPKLGVDLRYWDTSEHGFGKIYNSRVALSLKATF